MKTALDYAQEMIDSNKYREVSGQNRGPAIDDLNREFGYPLGSSWCALFASKAFKTALQHGAIGSKFYYTAGSQDMLRWFRAKKLTSKNPQDILHWKGALIIRTDPGGAHGHVALVKARFTTDGRIVALGTLEGNTDKKGGSNGDGAYERRRDVPLKPYTWTYCNTSEIAGGAWWN